MRWLALLVIVLSSFFISISCSGGEGGINIGDPCGGSQCQDGVLYFCGVSTIHKYADCDRVCDIMNSNGEDWEFTGVCDSKVKSGEYMECCECREVSTERIYCVNSQPDGL